MADRKISDLTALTTQASGDLLPIVDVSEAAAADKNKSITIQELFRGIPVNVGIGTTSPSYKVDIVSGTDAVGVNIRGRSSDNIGTIYFRSNDNATTYGLIQGRSDEFRITTGSNSQPIVFRTNSERARIDGSGRLLVNTSSSNGKFYGSSSVNHFMQVETVNGYSQSWLNHSSTVGFGPHLTLGRTRGTAAGAVTIVQNGDSLGHLSFQGADGTDCVPAAMIKAEVDGDPGSNDMPGRLVFTTTADGQAFPTERMRITSAGFSKHSNSGTYISSTGSSHEFRSGANNSSVLRIYHAGSSGSQYGLLIETANNQADTTRYFWECRGSTSVRATLRSNGGLANFQANNVNLCDEREKKNIEPLDSTWNCLKNWELKKFHYNEDADTDDKKYGVIAQQVAPHCPEVITDWITQNTAEAVLDDGGNVLTPATEEIVRMGVKEQQMMWMAIKALQEAQTRIETLEAEVAALKGA